MSWSHSRAVLSDMPLSIGDLLAVRPSVIAIMTVSRDTLSVRKEGVDTREIVDLIRI
jgi:hypothetical protein